MFVTVIVTIGISYFALIVEGLIMNLPLFLSFSLLIQRLLVYWCLVEFVIFEETLQWTKKLTKHLCYHMPITMGSGIPQKTHPSSDLMLMLCVHYEA